MSLAITQTSFPNSLESTIWFQVEAKKVLARINFITFGKILKAKNQKEWKPVVGGSQKNFWEPLVSVLKIVLKNLPSSQILKFPNLKKKSLQGFKTLRKDPAKFSVKSVLINFWTIDFQRRFSQPGYHKKKNLLNF